MPTTTANAEGRVIQIAGPAIDIQFPENQIPVINTAIPHSGVAWVSPHEQTGLTVPVNDPKALAAAACRLVEDPALRERLGRNGRERATAAH